MGSQFDQAEMIARLSEGNNIGDIAPSGERAKALPDQTLRAMNAGRSASLPKGVDIDRYRPLLAPRIASRHSLL